MNSSRADLKKAFEQHRKETQGQIKRLRSVLSFSERQSDRSECHGIRGLIAEKKAFVEEEQTDDLPDVFNVGAAWLEPKGWFDNTTAGREKALKRLEEAGDRLT